MLPELASTALLLTTFGLLLGTSVVFGRVSERVGVPIALIFLAIGVAAGSEGIGGIVFEDYEFTFRVGTTALVLILFDGGLNTPVTAVRAVLAPAAVLATVGVLGTAAVVSLVAYLLGIDPALALLIGAVVSSTDAAAVFSVLRGSGLHLKRRVGTTLEVESGINDPMAVLLTALLTSRALAGGEHGAWWEVTGEIVAHLVVGVL